MTTTTTTSELVPGYVDVTRLAVASFWPATGSRP
jgi:hypothetical protein